MFLKQSLSVAHNGIVFSYMPFALAVTDLRRGVGSSSLGLPRVHCVLPRPIAE